MKYTIECYLKNPETGEGGYSINHYLVLASSHEAAIETLKREHSGFDTHITVDSGELLPDLSPFGDELLIDLNRLMNKYRRRASGNVKQIYRDRRAILGSYLDEIAQRIEGKL